MKKFAFELQPVLSLREQAERIRQREFALAVQEIRRCEQRIMRFLAEREDAQNGLRRAEKNSIDAWQLMFHRRYINHLDAQLRRLHAELLALSRAAEKKRQELVEASKKKKGLEKLKERRRTDYEYAAGKEEQKMFDEIGGVYKRMWHSRPRL